MAVFSSAHATETVLYSFKASSDAYHPIAGLIADTQGALYGMAQNGGSRTSYAACDGARLGGDKNKPRIHTINADQESVYMRANPW